MNVHATGSAEIASNLTPKLATVSLPIVGMTCASCVGRVEKALNRVEGVEKATVNLATERADVTLVQPVDQASLVRAIEDAGYEVPSRSITLVIDGMTCASCVARVEKALLAVPGVVSATVNLATERASLSASGSVTDRDLVAAVSSAGYEARTVSGNEDDEAHASRKQAEQAVLGRDVTVAALLTLPVFVLEMGSHLIPAVHDLVMNTVGMGVLFRKGEALQSLKDARVVALDKTGTLTEGKPTLTDLETTSGHARKDVLALVASVEVKSEHPIARAIVEAAEANGLKLSDLTRFESVRRPVRSPDRRSARSC